MFHLFAEVFLGGTRVWACGMHQIILVAVYSYVSVVCSIGSSGFLGLLQDMEALQDRFCQFHNFWTR